MLPGSGSHENGTNLIFSDCQEDAVFYAALSSDTGRFFDWKAFLYEGIMFHIHSVPTNLNR